MPVLKRSHIIALGIAAAVVIWIVSGVLGPNRAGGENGQPEAAGEEALPQVRVATLEAEPWQRQITVNGRTEAFRKTRVAAEVRGRIEATPVPRGSRVEAGQVIVELAEEDRREEVARARSLVEQRRIEFNAAESLSERGFNTEIRRAETKALLDAAEAELRRAELALANTDIRAPYAGILEERPVEIGDFVSAGEVVANLVELDPIRVVGYVNEQVVGRLQLGEPARIRIAGVGEREGVVAFLSASADPATRTFRVEVEAPNPDFRIVDGQTAQLLIPLDTELAYQVSPAVLALTDNGQIGVKAVDETNIVRFYPVEILEDDPAGMWIGGLPENLTLITVGHDFVDVGVEVEPVEMPVRTQIGER